MHKVEREEVREWERQRWFKRGGCQSTSFPGCSTFSSSHRPLWRRQVGGEKIWKKKDPPEHACMHGANHFVLSFTENFTLKPDPSCIPNEPHSKLWFCQGITFKNMLICLHIAWIWHTTHYTNCIKFLSGFCFSSFFRRSTTRSLLLMFEDCRGKDTLMHDFQHRVRQMAV